MASNAASAVSCLECQRRKQKCNREFPCNHCLKRGVSHLCRFISKAAAVKSPKEQASHDGDSRTSRKRSLDTPERALSSDGDSGHDDDPAGIDVAGALNGLGYMSHHHHLVLGQGSGPKAVRDVIEESDGEQSEELKAARPFIPEKRYTDCLVDNWLNGANSQYYALYPPEFRTQYDGWWLTPGHKVTPELTSLILRVCACSLHFIIDNNVRVRLERDLGADVLTLAERMHSAAEKLAASIPPGKGGLVHVQQLFLTAFWFKSAERWTEAWHALSKAIRAANEIGLHQDALSEGMSEFDREMRRRMWVILYLWDFALGSMLSRPLLINHSDCTVVMPTLALEFNPAHPDQPSPFRHMCLHCQLCIDIAEELRDPSTSGLGKPEVTRQLKGVVDRWVANLPAEYALHAPDTRWDREHEWVVFQRRYLHLIGYMSLFSQLRPFVVRNSAEPMSSLEVALRAEGVQAALGLMDVSWVFFENLATVGAKFHYAIFCIFDSTTVMCSAFLHDEARNLPRRETVLRAMNKGLSMLAEVSSESKTTASLYRILKGLLAKLPLTPREQGVMGAPKRMKSASHTPPSDNAPIVKSPAASSNGTRPPVQPAQRREHSSSSASCGSNSTLGSPSGPARSDGSASLPEGFRSTASQLPPNAQEQVPLLPASYPAAVPVPDGTPSPSSFVPLVPIRPAYADATGNFLPTVSGVSAVPLMAPDGFTQATDFQYSSALGSDHGVPFSQPGWQPPLQLPSAGVENGLGNGVNLYHDGGLVGFDATAPSVLEHWEWQDLNLGHPMSWSQQPYVHANDPGGVTPFPAGLSGGFSGRGITSDGGESSGTEDQSR